MRLLGYIFCCFFFFSGCIVKKHESFLRFCTRVDAHYIRDLIPENVHKIQKYAETVQLEVEDLYDQLLSVSPEDRTFYNTLRVYDTIYLKLWMGSQICSTMSELHVDSRMRSQASFAASKINSLKDRLYASGKIERALQEYKDYGSDKKYNRTDVQQYLDTAIEEHKKYQRKTDGVDSLLGQFSRNVWRNFQPIVADSGQLDGVSESYKSSLQKKHGGLLNLPLDFNSFFEIMENAQDQQLRKQFFHAFGRRGYPENISLIQSVVEKRNNHAREFGYDSFVEYKMADHMVTDLKKIEMFLWRQVKQLQAKEQKMYKVMLKDKPESVKLSSDGKLYPWDETFLKSHFRKNVLGVDDQKVAEYFDLDRALPGILHLYEQFFSVSFQKDEQYSWWAKDVTLYRVSNERTKELLGYVFFDLFDRNGKNEDQKHITLVPGIRDDCDLPCLNVSVVVSDFNKPTSGATLLKLHEVKTLIHEVGHAIHACWGSTDFVQQSGTQVARDFVELPSQIFEQWLEEPEVLKQIGCHYQTGRPISNKLIKRIIRAQKYIAVSQLLKQTFVSLLMIELYKNEGKDPHQVSQDVFRKVYPHLVCDPDYFIECNIEHFVSYGPSYYSYVWTKVLAEKLFKKIKKRGILERSVGKQFAKHILSPGGSGDYHQMVQAFKKSI